MKEHSTFEDQYAKGRVVCYHLGYLIQGMVTGGGNTAGLKVSYRAPNPPDER